MAQDGKDGVDDPPREDAALTREVQDHLGRRLRTALDERTEKPSFLGESALPPEFETQIRRLENRERASQKGVEAVMNAFGLDEKDVLGPQPPRR